jgi:hypothetical protein
VEVGQLVVVDHGGSRVAHDVQPDGQARVGGGRRVQRGERTRLEPHDRGDRVLHLDALVREQRGVRGDVDRAPEEPQQQVDGVHALVHHGAAAVELPGAAPVARVVVLLAAPPGHRGDP